MSSVFSSPKIKSFYKFSILLCTLSKFLENKNDTAKVVIKLIPGWFAARLVRLDLVSNTRKSSHVLLLDQVFLPALK